MNKLSLFVSPADTFGGGREDCDNTSESHPLPEAACAPTVHGPGNSLCFL